jgi:hypothetical protein
VVRRRVDDVDDLVADPDREVELGAGVGLRGVLVVDVGVGDRLLELAAETGGLDRDVDDAVLVQPENDATLQDRCRVVEVDDRLLRAADRVEGAVHEVVTTLGQHLDGHVVGDVVSLDELPHEVEVGLARRREPDLDLLVAHPHEQVEHALLALGVHRVDERLVAVPEVDGAPPGRLGDPLGRPGAVGQLHGDLIMERYVLAERHPRRGLGVEHFSHVLVFAGVSLVLSQAPRTPRRGRPSV